MKMSRRKHVVAVIALSLALSPAACSSGNDAAEDNDVNAPTKHLTSTAWDAAAAVAVEKGGTLTLAINRFPTNFNDEVGVSMRSDLRELAPTRGSAIKIKADGTWTVDKNYASSVELVDRDPQVVEVKLNRKAVWQDGKPIVAKDMVSWWKAMNGSNDDFDVQGGTGFEDIAKVEQGDDEYTYTVTFDEKNADWPEYVYPKFPASVTSSPDNFNKGFVRKPAPGNGPFIVSKIDAKAGEIIQIPNPRWWGTKPKLAKIVFRAIDPAEQAEQFADEKIDAINVGQDKGAYDVALSRENVRVQRSGGLSWSHLTLNAARGPLRDIKVRRAIARALNREDISAAINKPLGAPAVAQGSMIYLPGQKGYRNNADPVIAYDPGEAEALLESAGYEKDADGKFAKDGKPLTLTLTVPSKTPANASRARAIQAQLEKVGITVKLDTVPTDRYFDDYVVPLNFEMATFSWQGTPFPVASRQALFNPVDSGQNFTGITSPKLSGLWKKANAELDPDKQISLANEIDEVLYSYVPIVPIASIPTIYVVANGLANYGAAQFQRPDFTKVGFTK